MRRFSLAFTGPRFMNGLAMDNREPQGRGQRSGGTAAGAVRAVMLILLAIALTVSPAISFAAEPAPPVEVGAGDNAAHAVAAEHQPGEHPVAGEHEGAEHEAGPPSINFKALGLQLLNFAVLLVILVKFGGGAINKALSARHQQLKADLASAAELRALAEAKLSKQEARLASLEHEIGEMRREIKSEAEAEKARLIAAAEERAVRIKSETAFLVEQQVREAAGRLRREAADTALKVAEEILRRAVGAGDQQRLLDTFVSDVEQPHPASPAAAAGTGTAGRAA
ncbi:MAG: ATP synthase F0 subunit B [Myxococcales bacterium]